MQINRGKSVRINVRLLGARGNNDAEREWIGEENSTRSLRSSNPGLYRQLRPRRTATDCSPLLRTVGDTRSTGWGRLTPRSARPRGRIDTANVLQQTIQSNPRRTTRIRRCAAPGSTTLAIPDITLLEVTVVQPARSRSLEILTGKVRFVGLLERSVDGTNSVVGVRTIHLRFGIIKNVPHIAVDPCTS